MGMKMPRNSGKMYLSTEKMDEKVLVTKSSMPPFEEYVEEIKQLWETHWLTNMGPKHTEFKEALKAYLRTDSLELFVNGHMALELTLQAMNLRGEVITTPFTFASTTHAIVRNGLEPVFCDINRGDYTIDASKIEELINERTCAILPVHVYGNICNVEEIDRIAKKYNLKVIYDAAHAFGEEYRGVGIGNYGDASIFSFHATKVFNTIEGGATCYSNKEIGNRLYELKNFGIHGQEDVPAVGANAKMNEFCAAMGLCNLRHIQEEISKRKRVAEMYCELLDGIAGIKLNVPREEIVPNYAYFPILIDESVFGATRDEVYDVLVRHNVFPRKYFYPLTSEFAAYNGKYDLTATPEARFVSKRILCLPFFADLECETVEKICRIIKCEVRL